MRFGKNLLVCVVAFGGVASAAAASTPQELAKASAVYPHAITSEEKTIFESAIKHGLKDPESARFRWNPEIKDDVVYCGFVNAKNSYGGYAGFKLFMLFHGFDREGKLVAPVTYFDKGPRYTPGGIFVGESVEAKTCAEKGYNLAADQAQD